MYGTIYTYGIVGPKNMKINFPIFFIVAKFVEFVNDVLTTYTNKKKTLL